MSMDRQQLYTALRNADKAGDVEGAKKIAAYIQSLPSDSSSMQQPEQQADDSGGFLHGLGNVVAGALRGATNIGTSLLHPFDADAREKQRSEIESALKGGTAAPFLPAADTESLAYKAGEIGTEIAGTAGAGGALAAPFKAAARFAPAAGRVAQAVESAGMSVGGPATTMGGKVANAALRVGGGAATGAAAGGLIGGEEGAQGGAVAGGLLGGIGGPVLEKLGGAVARRLAKPTGGEIAAQSQVAVDDAVRQVADDLGVPVESLPQATVAQIRDDVAQALQRGEQIDAAAMMRQRDFERIGAQPLLGQITRDPTQFAQELNLRGVSPEIAGRLREQNIALQKAFGQPAAGATESYQAGSQIGEALRGYDVARKGEVSALYKAARESAGKDLEIPLQGMAQDVADVLDNFGDKVPSGVINQFKKYGLLGEKQTKLFTVEEADKLMKVINSNVSNDPATNAALSRLRDSVRMSVEQVDAGGGVFAPAVKAAKERFSQMDAIPALKAVAEGNAAPDSFVQQFVVRGKTDEVKRLAELLKKQSPESFTQAKAQMADDIKRAAFGENLAGDAAVSPERLAKKLRELGSEKMGAFFSPAEIENYQTAARVAAYIAKHPNAAPVNTSNTLVAQLMQSPVARGASKAAELVPGGGVIVGATKAATGAVHKEMTAAQAMKAKVPTKKLDLTESQRRLLVKALGMGGAAAAGQLAN